MHAGHGMHAGQTEAVSLVMISGIVIALVGTAYIWGMPMIEKRSASADFSASSNVISDLDRRVLALANAGGGQSEAELSKPVTLVSADAQDPDNNSLSITYLSPQPMLSATGGGVIYLGAADFSDMNENTGIFGQSSSGVMTIRQSATQSGDYLVTSRLRYRGLSLQGSPKVFLIKLCEDTDLSGCHKRAAGSSRIVLTFRGTEAIPGSPDIVVTKIGVKLA